MTRLNEYGRSHSYSAVVRENQRLTPENVPEVRNIRLHVAHPDFCYVEGQHIGVIVPGPLDFGSETYFRLYSIANSPHPDEQGNVDIELCVRRCFIIDELSGEQHPGIASNYLCDAQPGNTITITGPYGDAFSIPEDSNSNLLMIGSGTGIAPFRAFIQHIYQKKPDWQGVVWLFYGALSGMEKLYLNDINNDLSEYYEHKTFQAFEGLSQHPWMHEDSSLTHVLEENARQIWELIQNPLTRIYIAGLSKMVHKFETIMIRTAGSEARWRWVRREMIEQKRWSKLLYD